MEVNYLGSVYPTRAVITTMKERRMGRIMFVSSQAGQIGLFGYTAYSPSKFALRGLAESLQMEVSLSRSGRKWHRGEAALNPAGCVSPLDKAIQHLRDGRLPSRYRYTWISPGEQDKGKLWSSKPSNPLLDRFFALRPQPLETKLISETSGVCQPDQVAKVIVRDAVVRQE